MDWYAPIARRGTVPLVARLQGRQYLRRMAEVRSVEKLSPQELLDYQWELLRDLLRHAWENTPFYRARFAEAGITPDAIGGPDDLELLPPLGKDEIRAHVGEMTARNLPESELVPDATGGTTGLPMRFYRNRRCLSYRAALTEVFDGWYGKRVGDRMALVWGAHQDYPPLTRIKASVRNALVDRLLVLDASGMTRETMRDFAATLARLRPPITRAYPRAMYAFARFVRGEGLTGVDPGAIVATAEPLYENERRVMEEVFGRPVYNRYGSREVGFIATDCPERRALHWRPDSVFLEWIKDGRAAAPGEVGELLVTDLRNYAMPLIRYRLGDLAERPATGCECGRSLPILGRVIGRDTDVLRSTTGALVSGAYLTVVFSGRVELSQLQIIQEDLQHFTIRLVRDGATEEHGAYLRSALGRYLGPDAVISLEAVDSIPRERSGKQRVVICRLPHEQLYQQ